MFKRVAVALSGAVFAAAMTLPLGSAEAATVGVAVQGLSGTPSDTMAGTTEFRPLLSGLTLAPLGTEAIKYFIPLTSTDTTPPGPANCVYGVSCGTSADTGMGGTVMSMFLKFSPVLITDSILSIAFEDLDLAGANDPSFFLESLQLFGVDGGDADSDPDPLTGLITNIGGLITGNADTQQLLSLSLAASIMNDPFFLEMRFIADSKKYGKNTPEYLIAEIHPVPLPAALALFGTGLVIMGFFGRSRRKAGTAV